MRSLCPLGSHHASTASAVLRPSSSKPTQQVACPRTVLAQYMSDRRDRRRDLVWDNVDDLDGRGAGWDTTEQAIPLAPPPPSSAAPEPDTRQANTPDSRASANSYQGPAARAASSSDSWGDEQGSWDGQPASQPDSSLDDGGWGEQSGPVDWGSGPTGPERPSWQGRGFPDIDDSRTDGGRYGDSMGRSGPRAAATSSSQSWDGDAQGTQGFESGRWPADQAGPGGFDGQQGRRPRAWDNARTRRERPWEFFADNERQGGPQAGPQQGDPEPMPPSQPSDVTPLSRTEMEAVLPVRPTIRQAAYYQPRNLSERVVQLMGSLAASMLLSKSAALAAPALLYPVWSPWIRAGLKNVELYSNQLKAVGLWRAQVLEVEVMASNTYRPGNFNLGGRNPIAANAVVRLLMGDPWEGGARVQLEFPYQPKSELLVVGEAVEALVLAKDTAFYAFKVIREVYAPGLGLWLAEYPFVDRTAFLDVSLQIERSRQPDAYTWGQGTASGPVYTVDVDISPAGVDDMQGAPMGGPDAAWGAWAPDSGTPSAGNMANRAQPGAPMGEPASAAWGTWAPEGVTGAGEPPVGPSDYGSAATGNGNGAVYQGSYGTGAVNGVAPVVNGEPLQSGSGYMDNQRYVAQAEWSDTWAFEGEETTQGQPLDSTGTRDAPSTQRWAGDSGDSLRQGSSRVVGGSQAAGDDWDAGWQQQQQAQRNGGPQQPQQQQQDRGWQQQQQQQQWDNSRGYSAAGRA